MSVESKIRLTANDGSDHGRVRPRTVVLMCQPRFAPAVVSGRKRRTIRPRRKRPVMVGDHVSVREWMGKPYRSKQRVLREGIVTRVVEVWITPDWVMVDNQMLYGFTEHHEFAWADGFPTIQDMRDWFDLTHSLPFTGDMIEWSDS